MSCIEFPVQCRSGARINEGQSAVQEHRYRCALREDFRNQILGPLIVGTVAQRSTGSRQQRCEAAGFTANHWFTKFQLRESLASLGTQGRCQRAHLQEPVLEIGKPQLIHPIRLEQEAQRNVPRRFVPCLCAWFLLRAWIGHSTSKASSKIPFFRSRVRAHPCRCTP